MIRIDGRAGSKDLIAPLRQLGVPVEEATLPAGDVEIMGVGPEGRTVPIGIEYKHLPDVLACMRDGRFAEQLRGMHESYEVCWLLIEGRFRTVRGDVMQIATGTRWRDDGKYRRGEFNSWLNTMCIRGGALLWRTEDQSESVAWVRSQYLWWTAREYEEHRAHLDYYRPSLVGGVTPFLPPTLVQKIANCMPGVGGTRSISVAKHFDSVRSMVLADEEEWASIKGIGKKGAKKLVEALGGSGTSGKI